MTDEQMGKFFAQAEQMGHSKAHINAHGSQVSTVTLNSIEEVRKLVHPVDPAHAKEREEQIQQLAKGRPRTLAEHIESYLYGTGDLSAEHLSAAQQGLPVTVQLVSELERTMKHGETIVGPSGQPEVWNYVTLRFYSDSYLTVKNTNFDLTVQDLVMQYTDPK